MKIIVAYLLVVLIWSTTPVAIQFSQNGLDFFTAVSLRMWVSALLSLPLVWLMRQRLVFNGKGHMLPARAIVRRDGAHIAR